MCLISVRLLGSLQVQRDDQVLDGLNARKVQELFAYLLLYRGRPHPRQVLAGLLWPERTNEQSMKNLRHALWPLQSVLDCGVLQIDTDCLSLNPGSALWLDVMEFERAYAHVRGIPDGELDDHGAHVLRKALELYRGDLLEGWYQDWCLFEREHLQGMYLSMLEIQMAYCETHGEYEMGLECGTCALRCDVAHERIHRRLMRLHFLAGNRTAALRQYERCVKTLSEELSVEPSERTVALYKQISSGRLIQAGQGMAASKISNLDVTPQTLEQALDHLKQLQTAFDQVERELQKTVRAVKAALNGHD